MPMGKLLLGVSELFFVCLVCLFRSQVDGSRLFKDVKAYYAAVKGRFRKHAHHIRQC